MNNILEKWKAMIRGAELAILHNPDMHERNSAIGIKDFSDEIKRLEKENKYLNMQILKGNNNE